MTITAHCETCGWRWRQRFTKGPAADVARAVTAAQRHGAANPEHVVVSKNVELTVTEKGSRIEFLSMEITRG